MKKFLILFASVSALALTGCGEAKKAEAPAEAPKAEAPAAPKAEAPAAPAAEAPKAAAPAADAMAMDKGVMATVEQLKAGAAAMTPDQKTAALASIRTAAETASKAAGGDDAAAKMAADSAEAAAKTALGM